MAEYLHMEPCSSCGAALAADAQWCGQCYAVRKVAVAPVQTELSPQFGGPSVLAPERAAPSLPATIVKSRWRKTATTFGPVGRMLATLAFVVPGIVFVVVAWYSRGFILAAPVIWCFVIMPWGLRDTWKAGQVSAS